jgi:phosphosulfolactate synthase (CoM biosynthesis protein A)
MPRALQVEALNWEDWQALIPARAIPILGNSTRQWGATKAAAKKSKRKEHPLRLSPVRPAALWEELQPINGREVENPFVAGTHRGRTKRVNEERSGSGINGRREIAMKSPVEDSGRAFQFLRLNSREPKPRTCGVTEVRGPYYTNVGKHYLQDILEAMGRYIDGLKFAGGSFVLLPQRVLRDLIDLCHAHGVYVSTGGFIETVLLQGSEAIHRYLGECREMGFDVVEVSSGFVSVPPDDLVRLVEEVSKVGLKPKPEVGIQFGAGGATSAAELEAEGTRSPHLAIELARRYLDAGAHMIMIESEGITENVREWKTDVVAQIVTELGTKQVMFEAADPAVFSWYIKNYGPEVNLFVDHSQIVQLECLRSGIWGTKDVWGRVLTYKG